jgi:FkbM family methyltransferase
MTRYFIIPFKKLNMDSKEGSKNNWDNYDGSLAIKMHHGFSLYLRPKCNYSKKRFLYKIAESDEFSYLSKLNMQNFVCFDIGSNIGYWSKYLLEISKVKEVHSFEPDEETFKFLKNNLNEYSNVRINKNAIGNISGYLKLYVDPNHSGDNRPQYTSGRLEIDVPCCTIDSYILEAKIDKLDFIKIDIQGGEISAIEGGINSIKRFRPLIVIEISPEFNNSNCIKINDYITKFVEDFEYIALSVEGGIPIFLDKNQLKSVKGNIFLQPQ